MVRPSTLSGPMSLMRGSVKEPLALPCSSVLKLPRSPTWRSVSEGAPCCLLKGLTVREEERVSSGGCWRGHEVREELEVGVGWVAAYNVQ